MNADANQNFLFPPAESIHTHDPANHDSASQSLRSQFFKKAKLEQLKENLGKASWEQEEDKDAELRYERFLMLQSLSKRMKKFYK